MGIYANLKVFEGTNSGGSTLTLPWPSREVEVINDSAIKDLLVKFNLSDEFATLNPTEVLNISIRVTEIFLSSVGDVNYRIRIIG